MGFDDPADQAGLSSKRVRLQGGEDGLRLFLRYDGNQLSFIGNIEWVEAEEFAGGPDAFMDRSACFIDLKTKIASPGQLDQRGCKAPAGGVSHHPDFMMPVQHRLDEPVEGRTVADKRGAKFQSFPLGKDGHPMVPYGS